ncbi:MAG: multiheme c-type cytochrome [Nitrospirota bacterium]
MRLAGFALAFIGIFSFPLAAQAHEISGTFDGFERPEYCGGCHKAIYDEWAASMHSKSSPYSDPVHAAAYKAYSMRTSVSGQPAMKPGDGLAKPIDRPYFCGSCHTPTASNMTSLLSGRSGPDPSNRTDTDGVTCSFCHKVTGLNEGARFHTYKISSGIKGNEDLIANPGGAPHQVIKSDFTASFKMCMGCHGKLVNSKGAVICSADLEGYSDCLPCHMPEAEGSPANGSAKKTHAWHGIAGGHDPDMLKKGAVLSLAKEMGRLLVLLKNPNPHFFPTANPMRMAYVKVEFLDGAGKVLYANFNSDPSEDPKCMLMKVFYSGGKKGVPAWEAEGVASDTRLTDNEERTLVYLVPKEAVLARAVLYYRLISPRMLESLRLKPDGQLEKPQVVSSAELKL